MPAAPANSNAPAARSRRDGRRHHGVDEHAFILESLGELKGGEEIAAIDRQDGRLDEAERARDDRRQHRRQRDVDLEAEDRQGGLDDALEELGATHVVNASVDDVVAAVKELTGGGVHHSFEAVGLKLTAEQAYEMLRNGGQATVIGMIPVGTTVELHGPELLSEKTLTGSNMGSNQFRTDMPRFVDMYLDGRLMLDEMVSAHIKLEDINAGFDEMKKGHVARSVIMFD